MYHMKAAVYYGPRDMKVVERTTPIPGDNDVIINVKACGVCGTDVHMFEGQEGSGEVKGEMIFGHELAGIITSIGQNVTRFAVGDRVCVDPNVLCGNCYYCRSSLGHFCENMQSVGVTMDGGFAEYCKAPECAVYALPDNMSYEQGAMAEPVACCLHGIDMCNIKPGSDVIVIGAGMIGLIMLALAKKAGACNVAVIETIEVRREAAIKLGADIAIDPINEDVVSTLKKHGIRGDCVIECVGKPLTATLAVELAGKKSTVMLFGLTDADEVIEIKPFSLFKKECEIKASFINPYTQQRAIDLIASGAIDVSSMIAGSVSIEELATLLSDAQKRAAGKFIVKP